MSLALRLLFRANHWSSVDFQTLLKYLDAVFLFNWFKGLHLIEWVGLSCVHWGFAVFQKMDERFSRLSNDFRLLEDDQLLFGQLLVKAGPFAASVHAYQARHHVLGRFANVR